MSVPLSILDLAPISEGCDAATALRNTVDLAQHAEQWGYKRYWIAEHHFVAVASSSPAVLIGQIAAATDRIRVGAAAVQLGQTTAVAVVESFGMLDAFYPYKNRFALHRTIPADPVPLIAMVISFCVRKTCLSIERIWSINCRKTGSR